MLNPKHFSVIPWEWGQQQKNMAKEYVLGLLVKILGDFIDNITEDRLKVGVWSGKIVLENLVLKQECISKLNLPVSLVCSSIEHLEVIIPWLSLGK